MAGVILLPLRKATRAGVMLLLCAAVVLLPAVAAFPQPASPPPSAAADGAPATPNALPSWLETVMKGVAAGAFSMFSLGFAAYTFLYGTLLKLEGSGARVVTLQTKLRRAIYWTAVTIWLAGVLIFLVFLSAAYSSYGLGIAAVVLAGIIVLTVCLITAYLTADIWRDANPRGRA